MGDNRYRFVSRDKSPSSHYPSPLNLTSSRYSYATGENSNESRRSVRMVPRDRYDRDSRFCEHELVEYENRDSGKNLVDVRESRSPLRTGRKDDFIADSPVSQGFSNYDGLKYERMASDSHPHGLYHEHSIHVGMRLQQLQSSPLLVRPRTYDHVSQKGYDCRPHQCGVGETNNSGSIDERRDCLPGCCVGSSRAGLLSASNVLDRKKLVPPEYERRKMIDSGSLQSADDHISPDRSKYLNYTTEKRGYYSAQDELPFRRREESIPGQENAPFDNNNDGFYSQDRLRGIEKNSARQVSNVEKQDLLIPSKVYLKRSYDYIASSSPTKGSVSGLLGISHSGSANHSTVTDLEMPLHVVQQGSRFALQPIGDYRYTSATKDKMSSGKPLYPPHDVTRVSPRLLVKRPDIKVRDKIYAQRKNVARMIARPNNTGVRYEDRDISMDDAFDSEIESSSHVRYVVDNRFPHVQSASYDYDPDISMHVGKQGLGLFHTESTSNALEDASLEGYVKDNRFTHVQTASHDFDIEGSVHTRKQDLDFFHPDSSSNHQSEADYFDYESSRLEDHQAKVDNHQWLHAEESFDTLNTRQCKPDIGGAYSPKTKYLIDDFSLAGSSDRMLDYGYDRDDILCEGGVGFGISTDGNGVRKVYSREDLHDEISDVSLLKKSLRFKSEYDDTLCESSLMEFEQAQRSHGGKLNTRYSTEPPIRSDSRNVKMRLGPVPRRLRVSPCLEKKSRPSVMSRLGSALTKKSSSKLLLTNSTSDQLPAVHDGSDRVLCDYVGDHSRSHIPVPKKSSSKQLLANASSDKLPTVDDDSHRGPHVGVGDLSISKKSSSKKLLTNITLGQLPTAHDGSDRGVHDNVGSFSRSHLPPANSEPIENSTEFQKVVQCSFFKVLKQINETFKERKKYTKNGKAGSLACIVCGRNSKAFLDTESLALHAFTFEQAGLRSQHLGFHRALCVLMGWQWQVMEEPCDKWHCEVLSKTEISTLKADLIIWPPVVILHDSAIDNKNPCEREIIPTGKLEMKLKDMGFKCIIKVCSGKPAKQGVMVVKFSGTFSGLKEAEKLHLHYAESMKGRCNFKQLKKFRKTISGNLVVQEARDANAENGKLELQPTITKVQERRGAEVEKGRRKLKRPMKTRIDVPVSENAGPKSVIVGAKGNRDAEIETVRRILKRRKAVSETQESHDASEAANRRIKLKQTDIDVQKAHDAEAEQVMTDDKKAPGGEAGQVSTDAQDAPPAEAEQVNTEALETSGVKVENATTGGGKEMQANNGTLELKQSKVVSSYITEGSLEQEIPGGEAENLSTVDQETHCGEAENRKDELKQSKAVSKKSDSIGEGTGAGQEGSCNEGTVYGYLGLIWDLTKLDSETKKRCVVKSKKEILSIADGMER